MLISASTASFHQKPQSYVASSGEAQGEHAEAVVIEGSSRGEVANRPNSKSSSAIEQELSAEAQRQLQALQSRDREVKAHEAAHMAAAAGLVSGGMSFTYQAGPDGRRYAVGGEVSIDSSPVSGDPQATLDKAQQIVVAALAPAQPSAQDRAVAARATRMAAEARVELAQQRREEADRLPVNVGTRSALDAYRSGGQDKQASVLDQTV